MNAAVFGLLLALSLTNQALAAIQISWTTATGPGATNTYTGPINPANILVGSSYLVRAQANDSSGHLVSIVIQKNGSSLVGGSGQNGFICLIDKITSTNTGSDTYSAWAQSSTGERSPTIYLVVNSVPKPTITWTTGTGPGADPFSGVINPYVSTPNVQYMIRVLGSDSAGKLAAVSIDKNGQPFGYAGGGDGFNGISNNPTTTNSGSDVFTAWATDIYGNKSETISWRVNSGQLGFKILVDTNIMTQAEAQQIVSTGGTSISADGVWACNVQQGFLPNGISPQLWKDTILALNGMAYTITEDDILEVMNGRPPGQGFSSDYATVTAFGIPVRSAMVYYENWEGIYFSGSAGANFPAPYLIPLSDGYSCSNLIDTTTLPPFVTTTGQTWTQTAWNTSRCDQISAAAGLIPLTGTYNGASYSYNSVIAGRTPVVVNTRAFTDFSPIYTAVTAPLSWISLRNQGLYVNNTEWKYYTNLALSKPASVCGGVSFESTCSGLQVSGFDFIGGIAATLSAGKDCYLLLPATTSTSGSGTYLEQIQSAIRYLSQNTQNIKSGKLYIVVANYGSTDCGFLNGNNNTGAANSVSAAVTWLKGFRNGTFK